MLSERQKNLGALVLGCALAFTLGEVGLRTYQRIARGVPFFSFLPGYHASTRFPLSPFLVFGPRMNEQLPDKRSPETSYFSSQGFRTHDTLGLKPAGQYRIFALGGSTTADITNGAGIHWPLTAERALHAAGRPDVKIYNASMSAYSTAHSLVRFEFDLLQYQPDMILVMHNINDLSVNYYAWHAGRPVDANYLVKYGQPAVTGVITDHDVVLLRVWHSVSARIADLLRRPPPTLPPTYDISLGLGFFKRNLADIVAVARAHGVAVALLTMPMCDSPSVYDTMLHAGGEPMLYPDFPHFSRDFEAYNQAIRDVGRELDVPVLDMRRAMPGRPVYFLDTVHHTSSGVQVLGEQVARALLPLLPPPGKRSQHASAP